MGKYKKNPMYNVLSIRITDAEKAALVEMKQQTRKSTSVLMREAMQLYADSRVFADDQEIGCLN